MDKYDLLGGPYVVPTVRINDRLQSIDGPVVVVALSKAPIGPWPLWRHDSQPGGKPLPVLYGDLIRAIQTETATAVAHWWGVDRKLVSRWRHQLGVPRFNAGTKARWDALAPEKLTDEARAKAREAQKSE